MNCKDCKHFHRSQTWSAVLTTPEILECKRDGTPVKAGHGGYRKLLETSKDGVCAKMTDGFDTPPDGVKYVRKSGNQWNDGIGAPRVGEMFGCIHFQPDDQREPQGITQNHKATKR